MKKAAGIALAIFIVIGLIVIATSVLNYVTRPKEKTSKIKKRTYVGSLFLRRLIF